MSKEITFVLYKLSLPTSKQKSKFKISKNLKTFCKLSKLLLLEIRRYYEIETLLFNSSKFQASHQVKRCLQVRY